MNTIFNKTLKFIKSEIVLLIAGIAAFLSMIFVSPSKEYLSYIDFRVLCLLFCLMAVVAGLNKTGVFLYLSEKILNRIKYTRTLSLMLILICFFTSMWITNDVALITFVPFAIMILTMIKKQNHIIKVVVLQTIAANLGSMLTPIGNPQNLYLYSNYNIPIGNFLIITLPISTASFVLLCLTSFLIKKEPFNDVSFQTTTQYHIAPDLLNYERMNRINNKDQKSNILRIIMYCILFLISLACVIRLLDYRITLLVILLCVIIFDRTILKKVDYLLLLTFVFFFLFVGNLGHITVIREFLAKLLIQKEFLVSILASQVISNVPASILLSAFTENYKALILGTNIGGLGTLIASLASLISYKFYAKTEGAKPGRYLGVFTLYNLIFLILLCVLYLIIY